jgi:hypothetical protein
LRTEAFDSEPAWVGVNNHPEVPDCIQVDQDFGYNAGTSFAGGSAGEIGGKIWRAARRAYYGRSIATRTFQDSVSASGKFAVTRSDGASGFLFGWFNSVPSAGWRNNNSLAFRIDGERGFYRVYFEYGTQNWSTGTVTIDRRSDFEYPSDGTVHTWSLSYDPNGNGGTGSIYFVLDDSSWTLNLSAGHKEEGAVFDRFGLWNRQTEASRPVWVYLDDLVLDGSPEGFATDPGWIGEDNRKSYLDCEVEPRHNFGYRVTNYAGGAAAGEMGGILWRTEASAPETAGYYADTMIGTLTLNDHLSARGKLAMTRTSADAGLYLGWFNTATYNDTSDVLVPTNFIGAIVEGPSRMGQRFNASYCTSTGAYSLQSTSPKILPTGRSLEWSIEYDPSAATNNLVVSVAGQQSILTVSPSARSQGATFNAFGIGTSRRGGHWLEMFFDDITYAVAGSG